jgi:hypothetical protein
MLPTSHNRTLDILANKCELKGNLGSRYRHAYRDPFPACRLFCGLVYRLPEALSTSPVQAALASPHKLPRPIDRELISFHFFFVAPAFLMIGAAVFASDSVSNPSTAENLRPID